MCGGLEVAQLRWDMLFFALQCVSPQGQGSLCLQSQTECQQAADVRGQLPACSDLGNLLTIVLNTCGWFSLKPVVLLPCQSRFVGQWA